MVCVLCRYLLDAVRSQPHVVSAKPTGVMISAGCFVAATDGITSHKRAHHPALLPTPTALSAVTSPQPTVVADAVRLAFIIAGGGSSKSASVASGAFADAIAALNGGGGGGGGGNASAVWCVDNQLPKTATLRCSDMHNESCGYEVVRKACCMCPGGGTIQAGDSNYQVSQSGRQ